MSHELIERYRKGATLLGYAAQGLSPEQRLAPILPGEWSPVELVVHVVDTDLVFAERLKRVLAEENPTLVSFDEQAWLDRLDPKGMDIDEAVALFAANRKYLARILERRPDADFARVGQHTEKGRMTLAELLSYVTNHLDHHLKFLYGKRATLGLAIYPRYSRIEEA